MPLPPLATSRQGANADELRLDAATSLSLISWARHRFSLHAFYGEFGSPAR